MSDNDTKFTVGGLTLKEYGTSLFYGDESARLIAVVASGDTEKISFVANRGGDVNLDISDYASVSPDGNGTLVDMAVDAGSPETVQALMNENLHLYSQRMLSAVVPGLTSDDTDTRQTAQECFEIMLREGCDIRVLPDENFDALVNSPYRAEAFTVLEKVNSEAINENLAFFFEHPSSSEMLQKLSGEASATEQVQALETSFSPDAPTMAPH